MKEQILHQILAVLIIIQPLSLISCKTFGKCSIWLICILMCTITIVIFSLTNFCYYYDERIKGKPLCKTQSVIYRDYFQIKTKFIRRKCIKFSNWPIIQQPLNNLCISENSKLSLNKSCLRLQIPFLHFLCIYLFIQLYYSCGVLSQVLHTKYHY